MRDSGDERFWRKLWTVEPGAPLDGYGTKIVCVRPQPTLPAESTEFVREPSNTCSILLAQHRCLLFCSLYILDLNRTAQIRPVFSLSSPLSLCATAPMLLLDRY
jgi:hypothetical protein